MYTKRKRNQSICSSRSYKNFLFGSIIIFCLHDRVRSTGGDGGLSSPTGCQNFSPSQMERKLRDEGDYDHRYMAADLDDAVDRFSDLADAKFIKKAEIYTCDTQCLQRTDQVRSTFAEYNQMPQAPVPAFPGPSFADIRQVLEGHLTQPSPPIQGNWNGALFPDFGSQPIPIAQPNPQGVVASQQIPPPQIPQQPALSPQFPPLPLDSGFPLAPPTLAPPQIRTTTNAYQDYDYNDYTTPKNKFRHPKHPPQSGGGMKWFTPGDLVNDSPLPADAGSTTRRNRRRRTAPMNSTSIGTALKIRCSKKGDEEQTGYNLLCGSCRVIRELPPEYFPRYINEISCSGQTCLDKATTGGGKCVEQFINFDILRNTGSSECQKWSTYTIAVPVCCSCLMSDALAQYLNMPWIGQQLTTSGPGPIGPPNKRPR